MASLPVCGVSASGASVVNPAFPVEPVRSGRLEGFLPFQGSLEIKMKTELG